MHLPFDGPSFTEMGDEILRIPLGDLGAILHPLSPLQRALVMAEVMGPPIALRRPQERLLPRTERG